MVYSYRRPPYLRWSIAVLIVVAALVKDLAHEPTETYPFAASPVHTGELIPDDGIEWREVPGGLLPAPAIGNGVAVRAITPGEPLMASMFSTDAPLPADWWSVPVALGPLARVGTNVLVVLTDPPQTIPGVVVAAGADDGFSLTPVGAVAIPRHYVEAVARAARYDDLVVVTQSR